MKRIFITLLVLVKISGFCQPVVKVIADSKTKLPIPQVFVSSPNSKVQELSDAKGMVSFKLSPDIKIITFYRIGYENLSLRVEDLLEADTVFLTEKPYYLSEIRITSKVLEEVILDKTLYVDDYVVLPNSDFLIITSRPNIKGFCVSYFKRNRGITFTRRFKGEIHEHFFTDCFNNVHLVTATLSRQAYFPTDSTFAFMPSYRRQTFDSLLSRITLRIDSDFIFATTNPPKNFNFDYFSSTLYSPFLTYVKLSKKKKSDFYTVIYNKEMREMIQSEISDAYMIQQRKTEIGARTNRQEAIEAQFNLFFSQIVKPIYAPIFLKNDTVVVFNFQENKIVFLNKAGAVLKQVIIQDFSKYHNYQLYYDEIQQKFYLSTSGFDTHILSEVNVYTGKFDRIIHLERPFPKNLKIVNGKAYYLVREKNWDDTSYLYQQNL